MGCHRTGHEHGFAGKVARNQAAAAHFRRAFHIEGAEHRAFRHRVLVVVIDGVHQHRHAERIGEQDEFLTRAGAHVAGIRQKGDALFPLRLRRPNLADEIVQMTHQSRTDLQNPRVGGIRNALKHGICDAELVEISHVSLPSF